MDKIEYTPGPWKYHDAGAVVLTGDGQMSVADIRGFGRLEKDFGTSAANKIMDANGRLIATAPDLLSALLRIRGDLVREHSHFVFDANFGYVNEAIKKAIPTGKD